MIKQHSQSHRRNKSELMAYPNPKTKKKPNPNPTRKRPNPKTTPNSATIHSLVSKSSKKANRKQVLVEDIDQLIEEAGDDFFCFGKGYGLKFKQLSPRMEEIAEVPDTGSYSQRNTDHDHNKENKETINYPEGREKFFRVTKNQQEKCGTDSSTLPFHSYRQVNNCSRRSSNHSHRSDSSQTRSTVQLSRGKPKLSRSKSRGKEGREVRALREKTSRMEKSIKMIWECMGEIWENSRMHKQMSERNQEHISDLSHRLLLNERFLLDLKLEGKRKDCSLRG